MSRDWGMMALVADAPALALVCEFGQWESDELTVCAIVTKTTLMAEEGRVGVSYAYEIADLLRVQFSSVCVTFVNAIVDSGFVYNEEVT